MTSGDLMYGAIGRGDVDAARELVARNPSVLDTSFLEKSWFHWASQAGQVGIMEVLVNAGMPIDGVTSRDDDTPLQIAAGQGHYVACDWLLNHGANINHGFGKSATPIFAAIYSKSLGLVQLFVERGADLSATFDDSKIDVIGFAQRYGTPEIVDYLQSAAASRIPRGAV